MGKKDKKQDKEVIDMTEECCCGGSSECGCGHHHHDDCCCCDESDAPFLERHYYTKAEKIEMLEEYLVDLKAEIAGVEEALAELRK